MVWLAKDILSNAIHCLPDIGLWTWQHCFWYPLHCLWGFSWSLLWSVRGLTEPGMFIDEGPFKAFWMILYLEFLNWVILHSVKAFSTNRVHHHATLSKKTNFLLKDLGNYVRDRIKNLVNDIPHAPPACPSDVTMSLVLLVRLPLVRFIRSGLAL